MLKTIIERLRQLLTLQILISLIDSINLILPLELCVFVQTSSQGIESSGCKTWLLDVVSVAFLHIPSQPKSLASLLHHLDHLPDTVFVLGGFVVQKQSRKHLDWSKAHLQYGSKGTLDAVREV